LGKIPNVWFRTPGQKPGFPDPISKNFDLAHYYSFLFDYLLPKLGGLVGLVLSCAELIGKIFTALDVLLKARKSH
jgi:hypothetical protein